MLALQRMVDQRLRLPLVAWELRAEHPLIDVRLFRRAPFAVANGAGLVLFFAFIGTNSPSQSSTGSSSSMMPAFTIAHTSATVKARRS